MNAIIKIFLFIILACASGCASQIEVNGYGFSGSKHEDIVAGKTTRDEVRANLGSPTTVGDIGDYKKDYYISRKTEGKSFWKPKVLEQQVLIFLYDKTDKVVLIEELTLDDSKNILFSEKHTKLPGNEITAMQQIMNNLGKYNNPAAQQEQ